MLVNGKQIYTNLILRYEVMIETRPTYIRSPNAHLGVRAGLIIL